MARGGGGVLAMFAYGGVRFKVSKGQSYCCHSLCFSFVRFKILVIALSCI